MAKYIVNINIEDNYTVEIFDSFSKQETKPSSIFLLFVLELMRMKWIESIIEMNVINRTKHITYRAYSLCSM